MTKGWKITIIIVSSILVLIFGFLSIYYLWPWNKDFFDASTKEFAIPGLETTFTPQGITQIDGSNKFIVCGYMSDGSASRYYVLDSEGKVVKYFTLKQSGEDYVGHASGILSKGSTLWTVGDGNC